MMISAQTLEMLVLFSTAMVAIAPVILIILWFADKHGGKLW